MHHAVDYGGQGVEFVNAVDRGAGAGAHGVVEQAQVFCIGGGVAQGHADGGVGAGHWIARRCRISGGSVGLCQDGFVGIHDGLDFCRGVGQHAGDVGAVQSRVDGIHVIGAHAFDACGLVDICSDGARGSGGRGVVSLGCGANGID